MHRIGGRVVYSASDLVGFLACEHLTHLERAATFGLVKRPFREDPELELIAKRGLEHEKRFLDSLQARGLTVESTRDGAHANDESALRAAADEVVAVARRGADVIYQATLFAGRWRGHADFLVRVEKPSELGPWSYEVYDTKLARQATAGALLQLCLYTDLLGEIQGLRPEKMHVVLGGSSRQVKSFRRADYEAYYRSVKRRFEDIVGVAEATFPPSTRPSPVEHCEVCRWSLECRTELRERDDLSLVAGITSSQKRVLGEHDVTTRTALAELSSPVPWPLKSPQQESLGRMREQARIQVEGEAAGRVLYELLDPKRTEEGWCEPSLGLLSLPEPSPGDLFFDIEKDRFALDDGIEYLFGILEPGRSDVDGKPVFHRFWSMDDGGTVSWVGEKSAFERAIDLILDRLARDPSLHVYHYAPYEPAALGRLMGRHATREDAVDRLLRGGVFVDLFRALRQSLRASVEGYSLKKVEPLYGYERTIDLRDARAAMIAFSSWLDFGPDRGDGVKIRGDIEGYNRDDCVSAWKLRDWLEERRLELGARVGESLRRPEARTPEPGDALADRLVRVQALEERLTADVPADVGERSEEQKARWLLAQLLSWHRREDKSGWWRTFHLRDHLTDEERVEEPEPIGELEYVGVESAVARSFVHRYRFLPQEHEIKASTQVIDPATKSSPGTVVAVNNAAGTLDLKRLRTSELPHPTSLVPTLVIDTKEQQGSLLRLAEWVADHGIEGPGPYQAGRELLLCRPPSLGQRVGSQLAGGEEPRHAARRLVLLLEGGCLAIQGPPGSGKTTTGAEMILDLVAAGKRVGITANSHKVIGNFLDEVNGAAGKRGLAVRIGQKPSSGEGCTCKVATAFAKNEELLAALGEKRVAIAGATIWMWAREEFRGAVDVLFVDEAGQMSLANVVAASPSASSLVLLGDPQQLDQPLRGTHPPGAERSALAHLLGEHATMPPELGLFLARTWRLHPDLCRFTSEVFYEGLLASEPGCERQEVEGVDPLSGAGLRFLPVVHWGNSKSSREEAEEIGRLLGELLAADGHWQDSAGRSHPLRLEDVLVITPYNAQARLIAEIVPGARVGTVDKFQGQQAPISIYSMASSTLEEAPRGMEFLYSLHRLNVATSRARCIAVVVASPELLRVRCRTERQMHLANALCRSMEMHGSMNSEPASSGGS